MVKVMGLEVERDNVFLLLKSHEIELSTEELQHLQEEQQKTLADDLSSDEDEVRESVHSSLVSEMGGSAVICGEIPSGHRVSK